MQMSTLARCVFVSLILLIMHPRLYADSALPERGVDVIFRGVISEIGKASFPDVPEPSKAIIVTVHDVISKAPLVHLAPNDRITVQVKNISRFKVGDEVVFFATGWIVGQGLAVKEVHHSTLPSDQMESVGSVDVNIKQQLGKQKDQALLHRINSARLAFVGRVLSVKPAPEDVANESFEADSSHSYESEHDPEWKDALVSITNLLKGKTNTQEVVVRFPGSPDIAWRNAPKLREGQEATFIFAKGQEPSAATTFAYGQGQLPTYTAPSQQEVLGKDVGDHLLQLLSK
jgi:hypothetical protein